MVAKPTVVLFNLENDVKIGGCEGFVSRRLMCGTDADREDQAASHRLLELLEFEEVGLESRESLL